MLLSFQEMREIRKKRRCELAHRKTYFEYRAYGASHQSTRSDNGEEIGHFVIKESIKICRWWCAYGRHPYPSRTRRLRRKRPMVLHWRRCGRAGGRQIKKKTTGWKPDEDKTGIGKWVLSETGWSQIRIVKSGANPYQPGRAVKICWFYQWLEILNKKSRRRNIWCF